MIAPKLHRSALGVYGLDYTISGAEYRMVPTKDLLVEALWVPYFLANPKSANLTLKS